MAGEPQGSSTEGKQGKSVHERKPRMIRNGAPADLFDGWFKAAASGNSNACVEATVLPDGQIGMRHSRDPGGPALVYTRGEMAAFLAGAKAGEFDHLA